MFKKRMFLALGICLLAGCGAQETEPIEAVGRWVSDQSPSYYFELYEDGSCIMFDSEDEWVSAGSYQTDDNQISFDMDTGSFTWSKGKDGMVFETTNGEATYYLQETDEEV